MADRRQIEAMVRRKEAEIQSLEAKIKEARAYLQALQDVLRRFPRNSQDTVTPEAILRPGSLVAQARETILKQGKAMHVEQILKRLGRETTRENKIALGGSISAYVRKGSIFTRVAPNTFGLAEFNEATDSPSEPPPDFGIESSSQPLDREVTF